MYARSRVFVRIDLEMDSGFGVDQIEFAGPGRFAIFGRPDVDQQQFVTKVGDVLQRLLGVVLIEEIGNDDNQSALRIIRRELPRNLEKVAWTAQLQDRLGNAPPEESDDGRRRSCRIRQAYRRNACRHTVSSRTSPT